MTQTSPQTGLTAPPRPPHTPSSTTTAQPHQAATQARHDGRWYAPTTRPDPNTRPTGNYGPRHQQHQTPDQCRAWHNGRRCWLDDGHTNHYPTHIHYDPNTDTRHTWETPT